MTMREIGSLVGISAAHFINELQRSIVNIIENCIILGFSSPKKKYSTKRRLTTY